MELSDNKIIRELFNELKLRHTQEDILAVIHSYYLKHPHIFKVELKDVPRIINRVPITDIRYRSSIIALTTKFYLARVNGSKAVYIFHGENKRMEDYA